MSLVAFTTEGPVATICLHDPKRRNALSEAMLSELIAAFDGLSAEIRVVVLRAGAGDKVWCAGFDIGALRPGRDPLARDGLLQGLFRRIADCPAQVIAMIHGSAWGGGTDLALRCDMLVGDPTASLAFTPARLGLPYDPEGLANAVLRAGPALVMEMFASAEPVGAERAHQSGLLNHLVAEAQLENFTFGLANRIAANAPFTVSSAKQHIRALLHAISFPPALGQALAEGRLRALTSSDYAEGLAAFAEKRSPNFEGR